MAVLYLSLSRKADLSPAKEITLQEKIDVLVHKIAYIQKAEYCFVSLDLILFNINLILNWEVRTFLFVSFIELVFAILFSHH